ncbi:hypothetical protein E3N88_18603 [Mikania micrantha]|uniref:Uncharacterized protein n=1 Tax=Mikania micrantha TaxID=192012 RepID=A0A5N6NNU9_9ASTR|nr:hypothetical protein E3N88_18603 [Mikania micrantha]
MCDLLCLRGADTGRGWTSTDRFFLANISLKNVCASSSWRRRGLTSSHVFLHLPPLLSSSPPSPQLHRRHPRAPPPTTTISTADNHSFTISPSTAAHPSRFPPPQPLLRDLPSRPPSPSSLRRDPSHPFVGRNPRSAVVVFNRWFVSLGFAISPTTALLHRRLGFGLRGFQIAGVHGDVDSGGRWWLNGRRGWMIRGGGRSEGVDDEIAGVRDFLWWTVGLGDGGLGRGFV